MLETISAEKASIYYYISDEDLPILHRTIPAGPAEYKQLSTIWI